MAWFDGRVGLSAFDRIHRLASEGAFDPDFYREFLSWMDEPGVREKAAARTIILVAVPCRGQKLIFERKGRPRELRLPPVYRRYNPLFQDVLADITVFTEDRYRLRLLSAPLKTISALAGFSRYGRNNITYVEGLGSAVQLVGMGTDLEIPRGAPIPEGMPPALDECRSCRACLRACPVQAITEDRFLFRGERCLTGFSETPGRLPAEYARLRTPVLIGCLACQESCPANRGRLHFDDLPWRFSEEETEYLLGERGDGPPPRDLADKVLSLGCTDITISEAGPSEVFRRNLRALLK
jgi:epoxyqueuosine reductase